MTYKGITRREFLRSSFIVGTISVGSVIIAACGGASAAPTAVPNGPAVTFDLSADDNVDFSQLKLEAPAGSKITLTLTNKSTDKKFNWVLAKPGKMLSVATNGSGESEATGYLKPGDPDIIVNTKLTKPGESDSITFTAPAPGEYQFFCTFPGYFIRMHGTLTTK
ncbi:MAG TPA: plastocyanin/azurin family copper-binding protein [Anaerolineae bacterium]